MKKFLALLLVVTLLCGMAVPALAATTVQQDSFDNLTFNPSLSTILHGGSGNYTLDLSSVPDLLSADQLTAWNEVLDTLEGKKENRVGIIEFGVVSNVLPSYLPLLSFVIVDKGTSTLTYNSGSALVRLSGKNYTAFWFRVSAGGKISLFGAPVINSSSNPGAIITGNANGSNFYHHFNPQGIDVSSAFPAQNLKTIRNLTDSFTFVRSDAPLERTLTVNYLDGEGNTLSPPVVRTLVPGAVYEIPSPEIPGYKPNKSSVSGTMPDRDETITVTYTKIPLEVKRTLTVNYIDQEGNTLSPAVVRTLAPGAAYEIPSPEIPDHMPDKNSVFGTMPDHDETITVTYTKRPVAAKYALTIDYIYENGTSVASSVVKTLTAGDSYKVDSPTIAGKIADRLVVSGTMPDHDETITVTYIDGKFPLTITYKYKSGATAAPTFTGLYVPGSSYEVDSPAVAGFAPDHPVVSGTMPAQPLMVAVVYAVNSGGGGDNPGGGSGGGSGGGDSGGGGSSGGIYNPFEKPDYPAYDGYDPFQNPYTSGEVYKGFDPFKKPDYKPYTSKSPFDYFLGR